MSSPLFILVSWCKEPVPDPPPEKHPEVLGDHPALAFVVALNACVDRGARDAFLFSDAGDRLCREELSPRLPLYRVQVDEIFFLICNLLRFRRCAGSFPMGTEKGGRFAVAPSHGQRDRISVKVAAAPEAEEIEVGFLHRSPRMRLKAGLQQGHPPSI